MGSSCDRRAHGSGGGRVEPDAHGDPGLGQAPLGDDVWEVTVTDGGGKALSTPVRITTSAANPKWYHITFTSAP